MKEATMTSTSLRYGITTLVSLVPRRRLSFQQGNCSDSSAWYVSPYQTTQWIYHRDAKVRCQLGVAAGRHEGSLSLLGEAVYLLVDAEQQTGSSNALLYSRTTERASRTKLLVDFTMCSSFFDHHHL